MNFETYVVYCAICFRHKNIFFRKYQTNKNWHASQTKFNLIKSTLQVSLKLGSICLRAMGQTGPVLLQIKQLFMVNFARKPDFYQSEELGTWEPN